MNRKQSKVPIAKSLIGAVAFSTLLTAGHVAADAQHQQAAQPTLPAAASQAALDHTTALMALTKQWQAAEGSAKSQALSRLIAKAEERRTFLAELIKSNPAEVLRVAIPEEKQLGMPAEVLELLEQKIELEGELEVFHVDAEDPAQSGYRRYLKTPFGDRFELQVAGEKPDFLTGSRVNVKGLIVDTDSEESDGTIAVDGDQEGILRLALDGDPTAGEPGPVPNTFGEQRTLVILMNFLDDRSQPWSPAEIGTLMGTVNDFIQENSYGQAWLNTEVTNWLTIPKNKADGCPTLGYEMLADQEATSAGYNLTQYSRLVYIWPKNTNCPFSGMGTVGGNPSRADINGAPSYTIISHELGHNLGLAHSHDLMCGTATLGDNCTVKEYGDYPDIMGSGNNGHFNAFQKDRLGWLGDGSASSRLRVVTESGAYTISPFAAQTNSAKALKVLKSIDSATGQKTWYYLESRQAIGFDQGLSSSWSENHTRGIGVRTGNKADANSSYLLDMTPGSTKAFIDAALEAGFSFNDPNAGVSFTTDWVDTSGAQVTVNLDGGSAPSCTRANPTISVTPGESQWVAAGTAVTYSVTLTNRDSSACSISSFALSASKPSGWSVSFANASLSLAPGSSATTTSTVVSATSAINGFYSIGVTAASGSYSASQTVTYVVDNPANNNAPVALNDSASTLENTLVTINVLANDSDPDGDPLTVTSTSGVNGTAVINANGSISFTPATGFTGSETFSYTVSDGKGGSASASVNVNVTAAPNNAPVAQNDSASTQESTAVTIYVLANDTDPDGDVLQVTGTSGVYGTAVINANGSITFTPAAGFTGTETFSYTVSDGKGGSASASVNVNVTAAPNSNKAPVAVNDSAAMSSESPITIAVLGNDWDPEGAALKVIAATQGSKGSVTINANGTVTYYPHKSFKDADSFSYTISDGEKSASATVSVTLQGSTAGDGGTTSGTGGKGNGKGPNK